jgi:hypothetical protein
MGAVVVMGGGSAYCGKSDLMNPFDHSMKMGGETFP